MKNPDDRSRVMMAWPINFHTAKGLSVKDNNKPKNDNESSSGS